MGSLFIFGFGYTATLLAKQLAAAGWHIAGTSRNPQTREHLQSLGYKAVDFKPAEILPFLQKTTHLVISTPLNKTWQDPVLADFKPLIAAEAPHLEWIGYLSTTGVYGDYKGEWVDESTPPKPTGERALGRQKAEAQWLEFGASIHVPAHVFRLAGIYGPGRNAIRQLKEGKARPIYKPGQVFSRIHVADIASILMASMKKPQAGNIYNVCDDLPAASHEVIQYAAELLHLPAPELIPFEQANLSDMGREFYESSRRVKNDKIKQQLAVALAYPTYREGLRAMLDSKDN